MNNTELKTYIMPVCGRSMLGVNFYCKNLFAVKCLIREAE
jgi:hypothetical protein